MPLGIWLKNILMILLFTKEQMEYMYSLEDSDTEDNFDNYPKRLSRAEEALIKSKKTQKNGGAVILGIFEIMNSLSL